jgi:hypothetical protein
MVTASRAALSRAFAAVSAQLSTTIIDDLEESRERAARQTNPAERKPTHRGAICDW